MIQLSKRVLILLVSVFFLSSTVVTWSQSMTGAISGVVTDASGAVVPGASVAATGEATGVKRTTVTDGKGFYSFPALDVGKYDVSASQPGFSEFLNKGVTIDANSAVRVDIALKIGDVKNIVTVQSDVLQVETQNTAMGEVIGDQQVASMPLNGRSYIDLLALQPGVSPYQGTSKTGGAGLSEKGVSGDESDGTQSVNGGRTGANGFMVNGGDAQEGVHNGAGLIPNLDSIAEFRIITNNFNAEYGNYSGGQINVVTKAGTNKIHGSAFDFLRNTDLDAADYFGQYDPNIHHNERGNYIQNQFGGTIGGPIKKDKMFLFGDYQGTKQSIGANTNFTVPSNADRTGDLSDQADNLTGTVVGSNWASLLSQKFGYTVTQGEPYYTAGCTSSADCVLPNAQIPTSVWDTVATNTLHYIPTPLTPDGTVFATAAYPATLTDNKFGIRGDANTKFGEAFVYFYDDKYNGVNPYLGSSVPGFAQGSVGQTYFGDLGLTTTLGKSVVNDARVVYSRVTGTNGSMLAGQGKDVSLASLGFVTPWDSTPQGGIGNVDPNNIGVPQFGFNNFNFGTSTSIQTNIDNTFQVLDNWTKIVGTHTLQFGGEFHYDQINQRHPSTPNGSFSFNGNETGVDFADYLLGAPDGFGQQSFQILDTRDLYYGAYAQDSWRARPTLTINYGVRWEVSTPWYDTTNKLEALVPGEQSVDFPNSPNGQVEPLDPGVPRTLAPIKYHNFAPRIGIAWAPQGGDGAFGKLFGGSGKTSFRVGYGVFYQGIEDATSFYESGDAPYGQNWAPPNTYLLDQPFVERTTGAFTGLKFPFIFPPKNVSPAHPDSTFNWAGTEPIGGSEFYEIHSTTPYSQQLEFSIQRQFGGATVASISYVGTIGNHLLTGLESNPGNQALCLTLMDPNNLTAASQGNPCGPKNEDAPNVAGLFNETAAAGGNSYISTRPYSIADPLTGLEGLSSNAYYSSFAHSMYNALQASLKNQTKYGNFLVSYTYAKAMDNGSDVFDSTYVYNHKLAWGLSSFDVPQDITTSYTVNLPFDQWTHSNGALGSRLLGGWSVAGLDTFAKGQPVQLSESDDRDLIGDFSFRYSAPSLSGLGNKLFGNSSKNPRSGQTYFNSTVYKPAATVVYANDMGTPCNDSPTNTTGASGYFMRNTCGVVGNSNRRFFVGPGIDNYNMSLLKNTKITEGSSLQFRFEAFNVFNHVQFNNPSGSAQSTTQFSGGRATGGFGAVTSDQPPRIMQAALKFIF